MRVTVPDVGGCGTYDASVDGNVYVRAYETKPASALRRQDGGWATLLNLISWKRRGCVSCGARWEIRKSKVSDGGRWFSISAFYQIVGRIYLLCLSELSFRTFAGRAGGFGAGSSVFGHSYTTQHTLDFIFLLYVGICILLLLFNSGNYFYKWITS